MDQRRRFGDAIDATHARTGKHDVLHREPFGASGKGKTGTPFQTTTDALSGRKPVRARVEITWPSDTPCCSAKLRADCSTSAAITHHAPRTTHHAPDVKVNRVPPPFDSAKSFPFFYFCEHPHVRQNT